MTFENDFIYKRILNSGTTYWIKQMLESCYDKHYEVTLKIPPNMYSAKLKIFKKICSKPNDSFNSKILKCFGSFVFILDYNIRNQSLFSSHWIVSLSALWFVAFIFSSLYEIVYRS